MSTNISKQKRDDLLNKIQEIRTYIASAKQDDNTARLLSYLSELEKDVNGKKYGLIFEEHREEIDEVLDTHTPVLTEDGSLFIDNSGQMNFLIEGDNLASLKLLEKTHKGKIDVIYIDPPYNTGNKDFIYGDAYVMSEDSFRHSKYASFITKRLAIMRKLLSNEGYICISIDDNEQPNMRMLCDQIFGEDNFIACMARRTKSSGKTTNHVSANHDYIIIYAKDNVSVGIVGLPHIDEGFKYEDEFVDVRGKYKLNQTLDYDSLSYSASLDYPIVDYTKSGSVATLNKEEISDLNDIAIHEELSTTKHGREYHHCAAEIGMKANLEYSSMNAILRRLFLDNVKCEHKIIALPTRALYSFVINNKHKLIDDVRDAMSAENAQITLAFNNITEKPISFPLEMLFTYDGSAKSQAEMTKNVYKSYLSSAEKRSLPEKLFEKYCESSGKISWFYKNGDKGNEYFSIVYEDNFGKQKSFYPDYIVGTTEGKTWIIETKGGFTKSGDSEDIDKYTAKKFGVLKKYLGKYGLQGGIVRQDKQSGELCICTETYSDDIKSDSWVLLSDIM